MRKLGNLLLNYLIALRRQIDWDQAYSYKRLKKRLLKQYKEGKMTLDILIPSLMSIEGIRQKKEDRQARRKYAFAIFCLVLVWIAFVEYILLQQGYHFYGFDLPDKVLLVLLGTTTLNVLGLFAIVANYLFPSMSHFEAISGTKKEDKKKEGSSKPLL